MGGPPDRRGNLSSVTVFRACPQRLCQFAHHEKQRFAVPQERERFGASEHAIPAKIVVVHTGQLHDGGNDSPVLLATAFVSAGRQMVLDCSVPLISQVLIQGLYPADDRFRRP